MGQTIEANNGKKKNKENKKCEAFDMSSLGVLAIWRETER